MGILSGLKVVDVTRGTAGPLLTQLLADMDPEMVRVDTPGHLARKQQGYQVRLRGRRSIGLDPARPESRAVLERLVRGADIADLRAGAGRRQPRALGLAGAGSD